MTMCNADEAENSSSQAEAFASLRPYVLTIVRRFIARPPLLWRLADDFEQEAETASWVGIVTPAASVVTGVPYRWRNPEATVR